VSTEAEESNVVVSAESTLPSVSIIYNLIDDQLQPVVDASVVNILPITRQFKWLLIFANPYASPVPATGCVPIYDTEEVTPGALPRLLWWTDTGVPDGYSVITPVGGAAGVCYTVLQGYMRDPDGLNLQKDIVFDVCSKQFKSIFSALNKCVGASIT
jgi:hypothetical protein